MDLIRVYIRKTDKPGPQTAAAAALALL